MVLLNRQSVSMFSKEELTRILSSGVYMDVEAMAGLNEKGLQDLTGMAVGQAFPTDCIEENVAHPLNGPLAGRCRDVHQSYWSEPGYQLNLVDPKAQTLARLVDFADAREGVDQYGRVRKPFGRTYLRLWLLSVDLAGHGEQDDANEVGPAVALSRSIAGLCRIVSSERFSGRGHWRMGGWPSPCSTQVLIRPTS